MAKSISEIEGVDLSDPLHQEFVEGLEAYEKLLFEKNGRKTNAQRTRNKLKNKGVEQSLEDWAIAPNSTQGFDHLIKRGQPHLTGEFLVLKYRERFSKKAVALAEKRLKEQKVDLNKLLNHEAQEYISPDEVLDNGEYPEGSKKRITVNSYERNPQARKICLEHYGYKCSVCEFNFKEIYGEIGKNFIHVHHKVELSTLSEEYKVDPIEDLAPVLP